MDDTDEDEDSEIDLLLWMSTPTSSERSSKRRLRYLELECLVLAISHLSLHCLLDSFLGKLKTEI